MEPGVLNSYLVEISADILQTLDHKTVRHLLLILILTVADKGTGRWTSISATQIGVLRLYLLVSPFCSCSKHAHRVNVTCSKQANGLGS